jgi:hypothetical protein
MVCVVPKALPAPTSYTTAFPATENPISQGGIWLNGLTDGLDWNDIQTSVGKAYAGAIDIAVGGDSDSICCLRRSLLAATPKQFAEATFFKSAGYNPAGDHEFSLLLRFSIAAHNAAGIEWYTNQNLGSTVVLWNGAHSDFTPIFLCTVTSLADGDVFRMEVDNSNVVTCYQSGSVVGSGTVSGAPAIGNPGFGNNPTGSGVSVSGLGWKTWRGGSF